MELPLDPTSDETQAEIERLLDLETLSIQQDDVQSILSPSETSCQLLSPSENSCISMQDTFIPSTPLSVGNLPPSPANTEFDLLQSPSDCSFPSPSRAEALFVDEKFMNLESPISEMYSPNSEISLGKLAYAPDTPLPPPETNAASPERDEWALIRMEDLYSQQLRLYEKLCRSEAAMRHVRQVALQQKVKGEKKYGPVSLSPSLEHVSDPPSDFPYPDMFMSPLDHLYGIQTKLFNERIENKRLSELLANTQTALSKVEKKHLDYHRKARTVFQRQQRELRDTCRRLRYVVEERDKQTAKSKKQTKYIRKLESLLIQEQKRKPHVAPNHPTATATPAQPSNVTQTKSVGIQTNVHPVVQDMKKDDDPIVAQLQHQMLQYYKR